MKNKLQKYFPIIRTKGEILEEIKNNKKLWEIFCSWKEEYQQEYLNVCTGVKGLKLLYDTYFKAIMNPDTRPERLNDFLSEVLGKKVKILKVLPNESTRIASESSLLVMDIVVELEDGSIANVEVQKLGYRFPGERSACYSADLLLRQYKRVREELGASFSYKDIKKVYTIVLFETSNAFYKEFSREIYLHRFHQTSDTGLETNLLQEYIFICLDIFSDVIQNEDRKIQNKMEEWLVFLSQDNPEMIIKLLNQNPAFHKIYEEVYNLCLNSERMIGMFSKELEILDRNTVKLMIDEMEEELAEAKKEAKKKVDEAKERAKKQVDEAEERAKKQVDEVEERAKKQVDEVEERAKKQVNEVEERAKKRVDEAEKRANEAERRAKELEKKLQSLEGK